MLPGEKRAANPGQICDVCDCPAVAVLCTESDSFGDETMLLCKTHNEEQRQRASDAPSDRACEKCGSDEEVRPMRDMEEGSHGPVYWWCAPCRIAFNKTMREAWCPEDADEDDGWEY